MATGDLSRQLLSGSTDGLGVKVVATATAGTTIHTAHATSLDALYVNAFNSDSSDRLLTLEMGGATDPDNIIEITVAAGTYIPVLQGEILTNSKVLRAFAAAANVIVLYGYVNRMD